MHLWTFGGNQRTQGEHANPTHTLLMWDSNLNILIMDILESPTKMSCELNKNVKLN